MHGRVDALRKWCVMQCKMTNHGQAGSRLVPERPALQTYFTGLYDSFILAEPEGEYTPDAWNKLVLLCYRLLQLTTGIRTPLYFNHFF